jgi:hypothetical protein
MSKDDLPKILTISPETWVKFKGRTLEDYEFVELDSHNAPWVNEPSYREK